VTRGTAATRGIVDVRSKTWTDKQRGLVHSAGFNEFDEARS